MTDATPPDGDIPAGITLRSPSDEFPASPKIALTVPASWRPEPTTDAALLAFDTQAPPHFRTNVLVTVDRVRRDAELRDAVQGLARDAAAAYPDFRVIHVRNAEVGAQPAALRLQTFTPREPAAAPVFQLQVVVFAPAPEDRPTRDLVQVHATCSAELAGIYAPTFEEIVSSFAFE